MIGKDRGGACCVTCITASAVLCDAEIQEVSRKSCLRRVIMSQENSSGKKSVPENFAEMFKAFGSAISEIFDDPKLKEKAKEFAESAVESSKTFASRFTDEDVKDKFRDVGKAAQDFGKRVADSFRDDKGKEDSEKGR